MHNKILNKNFKLTKFNKPYPFAIFNNFFEKNFYQELEKSIPLSSEFLKSDKKVGRFDVDISYESKLYKKILETNNSFKKIHNYIYSNEFLNFFLKLFEEEIDDEYKKGNLILDINKIEKVDFPVEGSTSVNIYNIKKNKKKILYPRFDVGVGLKNYGKLTGGGGIHIDNPQRIISIILFIGGYESISGGEHRIWEKKNNELDLFKSIKPEQNLLIASLQTNSAFHDVNPVKNIIGQRNTAYAAISCNSYVWKSIKRNTFNKKYNKNRYKKNITDKFFTFILTFIKKLKLKYL